MSMVKQTERAQVPAAAAMPDTSNDLRIEGAPDQTSEQRLAKVVLGPTAQNALSALTYAKSSFGSVDIQNAFDALTANVKAVQAGDLSDAEAMLISQATALNVIFNHLARRSHGQEDMKHLDTFLRLALKAQNQCRMTLESLATIKNPPIVFARQANIAHTQQVNNGAPSGAATRAAKIETEQTKLLEAGDGQRLDTGAASAASGADPLLEAVGEVHRAAHR